MNKAGPAPAINNILPVRPERIFIGEKGDDQYGGNKNENTRIIWNCAPYIGKGKWITQQTLSVYFWKTIICYIIDHIIESRNTNQQ